MKYNPVAIIFVTKDDEYAQRVDGMLVKQARKDPRNKDLIPDEIGKPIPLAKQAETPAMAEMAVLVTYEKEGIMCVDTHPNLHRQGWTLVARGVAEVMPHKPFHVSKSKVFEKETHVPKIMIAAQGSHIVAWLTTC